MALRNDIYGRGKKLEKLMKEIRGSEICSVNTEVLLKYEKAMFLDGIGVERREKVIRTLFIISKWEPLPFAEMGREDVENIVGKVERSNNSEWTKHDYKVVLKKFFKWLRGTDIYPEEVRWIKVRGAKNNKLPEDMLTQEEVKSLIDHAQSSRDKALISVLYESGCRVGELCSLRMKDVSFDEYGTVVVFPSGKTGPRRVRLIISTPFLATWIETHPLKEDPNSWLWVNVGQVNHGKPMNYAGVRKALRSMAQRARIKKAVNPHNFRHSRATALAGHFTEAQMNEYLGWIQGSRIPQIYVHLSGRDVDDAVLRMNGLKRDEKEEDKGPLRAVKCPRCGNISVGNFCNHCGAVLNIKTAVELQDRVKGLDEKLANLLQKKEVRDLLIRELREIM